MRASCPTVELKRRGSDDPNEPTPIYAMTGMNHEPFPGVSHDCLSSSFGYAHFMYIGFYLGEHIVIRN